MLEFIDEALDRQRRAIRLQAGFAAGVMLVGVAIVVSVHVVTIGAATDGMKWLITIGGGFVSTLSGFPVQQVIAARDRAAALEVLKRMLAAVDPKLPADTQAEQRFWRVFDKALGV